jgi:hypothetical protein
MQRNWLAEEASTVLAGVAVQVSLLLHNLRSASSRARKITPFLLSASAPATVQ